MKNQGIYLKPHNEEILAIAGFDAEGKEITLGLAYKEILEYLPGDLTVEDIENCEREINLVPSSIQFAPDGAG